MTNTSPVKVKSSLLSSIGKYKWRIIIAVLLSIIATLGVISSPIFVQSILKEILKFNSGETATADEMFNAIVPIAVVGMGVGLVAFVMNYIQFFIIAGCTTQIGFDLREKMSKKINKLPLNYFDTRNIGDILSISTNDIETISNALNLSLSQFIASVVTLVGIIVLLFIFSGWQLALIACCMIPVAFFILLMISTKSQKYFDSNANTLASMNSLCEENFTAYNILRVFNSKEQKYDKFYKTNKALEKANYKSEFFGGLLDPVMKFVTNFSFAIVCAVGGIIAFNVFQELGKPDIGTTTAIVTALMYIEQLINPLSQIALVMGQVQQMRAASARVFAFLNEPEEIDETSKTDSIEKVEGNIEFEHVRFGYNSSRVIVKDFSEVGKHGQKIAIVGPTGAGKTTMVNLLMRFYDIDSGTIKIDGKNTADLNRSYVRSLFGMVLQDTWLFQGTIMENLKFSRRDATDEEVIEACKATHCDTFIRQQPGGYNGQLSEGLSSGQKQLLTIARAMVQNAPMLILDEATSSVDTRTELMIQDAMDKLMKGRTSFVIAHRLSTIKNSDLILVMRDGDVIESGNHEELMNKKGFYSELYNSQFSDKGPQID